MRGVGVVAAYALRECLRRRAFAVVLVLTVLFLVLYGFGASVAFDEVTDFSGESQLVDAKVVTGSTIFGLAIFSTLFLGTVLAVFLTLSAVRGDAERGLLQPLVVRPIGRTQLLAGRFIGAAAVCSAYVLAVYLVAMLLTGATGGWWPDRVLSPALGLTAAVTVIVALSLLGSVHLSATANGIAVFMIFGAGLAAGLLGQIGEALGSESLRDVSHVVSLALPFEALYQQGLDDLTADAAGATSFAVRLGPFGGAEDAGPLLWPWAIAYVALVALAARAGFLRRDL